MSREIDIALLEICNLAQDGFCLKDKWGKCPYPTADNDDGHKCGQCVAEYITDKLGYRLSEPSQDRGSYG